MRFSGCCFVKTRTKAKTLSNCWFDFILNNFAIQRDSKYLLFQFWNLNRIHIKPKKLIWKI